MTDTTLPPGDDAGRPHRAGRHPAGDAAQLHRLRDERDRRPRAAGGPRRAQAGAPPRAVRDVRLRLPPRPRPRQVRARRRRDDGQLPPARRLVDLRHPGADGPAVVAALPAGRRAGQLRLAGQRPAGRDAVLRHGDALVRLPFGQSVRIADVVPGARAEHRQRRRPQSAWTGTAIRWSPIDCSTRATHQTYTVRTAEGYEVTGTANHPLLCLVDVAGVPTLLWKLIEEIRAGRPRRACSGRRRRSSVPRTGTTRWKRCCWARSSARDSCPSSGRVSTTSTATTSTWSSRAYDAVVGGPRYVSRADDRLGHRRCIELDIQNLTALQQSRARATSCGQRSADKVGSAIGSGTPRQR